MTKDAILKAGNVLIPMSRVRRIDISEIEAEHLVLITDDGEYTALGFDAIEIVMLVKPSALEGRRLKWNKGAWALHNVLYHPLMQILVWMGFKKEAIRLHDWSTPRPR